MLVDCLAVICCCEFVTLLLGFGLLGVMMRNGFRFAIWVVSPCEVRWFWVIVGLLQWFAGALL